MANDDTWRTVAFHVKGGELEPWQHHPHGKHHSQVTKCQTKGSWCSPEQSPQAPQSSVQFWVLATSKQHRERKVARLDSQGRDEPALKVLWHELHPLSQGSAQWGNSGFSVDRKTYLSLNGGEGETIRDREDTQRREFPKSQGTAVSILPAV